MRSSHSVLRPISLVLLTSLVAALAMAGTPMPDPLLAAITEVRFSSASSLDFEPIPGLKVSSLRKEISERCTTALHRAGFKLADSADAHLLVEISHAWNGESRDEVALLVRVELHVSGEPQDVSDSTLLSRRRVLTVWVDEHLELADAAEARATILESLDSALQGLIAARSIVEKQAQ